MSLANCRGKLHPPTGSEPCSDSALRLKPSVQQKNSLWQFPLSSSRQVAWVPSCHDQRLIKSTAQLPMPQNTTEKSRDQKKKVHSAKHCLSTLNETYHHSKHTSFPSAKSAGKNSSKPPKPTGPLTRRRPCHPSPACGLPGLELLGPHGLGLKISGVDANIFFQAPYTAVVWLDFGCYASLFKLLLRRAMRSESLGSLLGGRAERTVVAPPWCHCALRTAFEQSSCLPPTSRD